MIILFNTFQYTNVNVILYVPQGIIPWIMYEKNNRFDRIIDRRGSGSVKWDRYQEDVLPLWVADMDFPVMDAVQSALRSRIEHPFFGYQKPDEDVIDIICQWVLDRYHWRISHEDVLLLPGVVSGFNWAASALVDQTQAIAFQTPVYFPFYQVAQNQKIDQITIPLTNTKEGYVIDFDLFEKRLKDGVRMFLLCNPHNPVGRVFSRDELENIGEMCMKYDVLICSDEIHCDLIYSGHEHIPIASLSDGLSNQTVTLMAPSKTFNIPGLQFSFAICRNKKFREILERARRGYLEHPNILAVTAAKAAYLYGREWLETLLKYLEKNRMYVSRFLRKNIPEIQYHVPEGTYLAWLDCSNLALAPSPYAFFLKQAKVALNDGKLFGEGASEFVRLNFGCPRSILDKALESMSNAVEKYR